MKELRKSVSVALFFFGGILPEDGRKESSKTSPLVAAHLNWFLVRIFPAVVFPDIHDSWVLCYENICITKGLASVTMRTFRERFIKIAALVKEIKTKIKVEFLKS